jgi:hypothetical protein
MAQGIGLDLRFLGAPEVIEELQQELAGRPTDVDVVSSGLVNEPTDLSFDLGQVADLVAVVNSAASAMVVLLPVFQKLFGKRAPRTKIVVESPLGKVTLDAGREMSEEEIRAAIRKLTEI